MLSVMRCPEADQRVRADMAKAAAPYMHPRLNSVEHVGEDGGPVQVILSGDDAEL